jgi:PDZ domain
MRNVSYLGLCWAMTLGLVAIALGQEQSDKTWKNAPDSAPQQIDTTGLPIERALPGSPSSGPTAVFVPASDAVESQKGAFNDTSNIREQPALPAPDRSLLVGPSQSDQPATIGAQRRGELGVWMGDAGGQGVRILRVTSGSAAEQAGLRVGDIILQVNGRDATSPRDAALLIRQLAIGETGKLAVWRDGKPQALQITMRPIGENARQIVSNLARQTGFGRSDSADSDLASRTKRLEQQIDSLTQELAAMRQELTQLRTAGPMQTGFNSEANQNASPQAPQTRYNEAPKAAVPTPANPVAPPPGFGPTEEKPAKPAADEAKPLAPPAPSTEKSSSNDLFGPELSQPKSDEQPKAEEKPKADDKSGADELK